MENPTEVLEECLTTFKTQDYIMEPGIFTQLKRYILKSTILVWGTLKLTLTPYRYFTVGGSPAQVIEMLSQNYTASAQMANLMAEWLILAGATITDVQSMVENHLKEMILKTFDPKKADTIFTEEGEVIIPNLIIYLNFLTICFLNNIYRLLPG